MKSTRSCLFLGHNLSLPAGLLGMPLLASILFANNLVGQLVTPPEKANPAPVAKEKVLLEKVMTELPRYGDNQAPVVIAEPKPPVGETTEIVHLVPYHVVGEKELKLSESDLRTKKAFSAEILKEYDFSVFSLFQHREAKRLENRSSLQSYADSLMLAGDSEGSSSIRKESDRLFLRPHDPESEAVDQLFNPRIR